MDGKEVVAIDRPRPAAAPTDLMAALKQSLAQMEGKKKGPQRVESAQRATEIEVRGKQKSVVGKKKPPKRAA
jgi:non-homologous end joining protein Ku